MPEKISFNHWKTGKKKEYLLNQTNYEENITSFICPFDKTSLLTRTFKEFTSCFCPNCCSEYSIPTKQETIEKEYISMVLGWKEELSFLEQKKKLLEERINYIEKNTLNKNKRPI